MANERRNWLVETDWLADHLDAPDIAIVDASWHMPNSPRDAYQEYLDARIPGAVHFDIDEIADTASDLPHMLASPVKFSARMRKMGIGDGMRIVVYDSDGISSSPRVWWTFRVMGIEDVAVLNGGLRKWRHEDRPLEDGPPRRRTERHFTARRNGELVRDMSDVAAALADPVIQVYDTRSQQRFGGHIPEPREGLRAGHMPGSQNLPFSELLNGDGTMKSPDELRAILERHNVDFTRPLVASCGSGVTACILNLALAVTGHRRVSVYDGSWTEWGADPTAPIETSPEPE